MDRRFLICRFLICAMAASLVAGGCGSTTTPSPTEPTSSGRATATTTAAPTVAPTQAATQAATVAPTGTSATAAPATVGATATPPGATIPQPDVGDLPIAPESERVDLAMPTFSNPTIVTNPFFPVSSQQSVLLLGEVETEAFRTEVTLLPDPRIIEWEGQRVATLVSQYVAYLGGRIEEVAYDLYAQADDGSVWYFGEDVFNFADGAIVDTHGTWIAGMDGPAAMIMPADPQVGDVYRPENIPGLVFEEVTVKSVGVTVDGPLGPIEGAIVIDELHMDGGHEEKTFAPGYGEFYTATEGDVEALALAAPRDAATGVEPTELQTLLGGAMGFVNAAALPDGPTAQAALSDMTSAWDEYRGMGAPVLIEPLVDDALAALTAAIEPGDAAQTRQAGIDLARLAFDLRLRHRPVPEIDLARFDLWAAQLQIDAAAGREVAVNGDLFSLDYIRDRIIHALSVDDAAAINLALEELTGVAGDTDLDSASKVADQLRELVAGTEIVATN